MWCVGGLVFATQDARDLGTHAARNLVGSINNVPLALRFFGTDGIRPVAQRIHSMKMVDV